ncbi:MAG: putative Ig domain-containing protein, partial [Dehalococcoidia bacterium]|nr:putative Ig domain-containing protein [Dehalococcoidia bacterium]
MYKACFQKKWLSLILCVFLIFSLAVSLVPKTVLSQSVSPYEKIITDENGRQITMASSPLPPPKIKVAAATVPDVYTAGVINTLNVPAFDWSYGCFATSAAMLFGYYDRTGYSNMYTGPTGGGVCPLNNSTWGHTTWPSITCGECPLSATHNGIDGRAIRGHVDDYWIDSKNPGPDPWVGHWAEHTLGGCTGDYMGTNQWKYGSPVDHNVDGDTRFWLYNNGDPLYDFTYYEPTERDGCHGMRLFAESRGYTVVTNFNQYIQGQGSDPGKGFTFANFQSEIDAGRPVLIHVSNPSVGGHTMLGYGYDTSGNTIYVHDTWDYSGHTMTWGGTYPYGVYQLQHYAVTAIRLQAASIPLNITTTSLPNGTVNVPYSQTLQASGGSGSYTWSIISGSLPVGLSLTQSSGLIAGTPTTAATSNFTVQVNDGSTTASKPLSITINSASTAQKLVGTDTSGTATVSPDYIQLSKFTASATGTISQIKVYSTALAHVKVAIYADNNDQPGALLNANNDNNQVDPNQWSNISIANTSVTSGTAYWLGAIMDTYSVTKIVSTNPRRYKAQPYAGFSWPGSLTDLSTSDNMYLCIAGW